MTVFCNAGLTFVADCGMPPRLPNTFIQAPGPTTEGSEIVYGCIENHVSKGDPSIFCKENGLWTTPTLYCIRMLFINLLHYNNNIFKNPVFSCVLYVNILGLFVKFDKFILMVFCSWLWEARTTTGNSADTRWRQYIRGLCHNTPVRGWRRCSRRGCNSEMWQRPPMVTLQLLLQA